MQVSRIAVSNQFSGSGNQKSPAFGFDAAKATKIKFINVRATDAVANVESRVHQLRIQLQKDKGIPWEKMFVYNDGTTTFLICNDPKYNSAFIARYRELSSDFQRRFGVGCESDGKEVELLTSNVTINSRNPNFVTTIPHPSSEQLKDLYAWNLTSS
jgi:hypothetical protein